MSFGSILQASSMSPEKRQMVLEVLGSLSPVRVIWKWEEEHVSYLIRINLEGEICQYILLWLIFLS